MFASGKWFAVALVAFGVAACDESPVTLPEPTSIAAAAAEIKLTVGDVATLPNQVLDQQGQVIPGVQPTFTSNNPSVAAVDATGTVRAMSAGSANITAAYGSVTATSKVTVGNDLRSLVRSLDVLADSVAADVRVGAQAVALRAFNGFGQPVCPAVNVQVNDPSVASVTQDGCRLVVTPRFQGRTTVRVSADDVSDTFVVNVTSSGMTALFSSRPAASALFAGNTVSYSVRVIDAQGNGIAGRRVAFDVSAGTLSTSSSTTDSGGYVTVQWTLPINLRQLGNNQSIAFSTVLPNGAVSTRTETAFINGASLASITLYRTKIPFVAAGSQWEPITTASITSPRSHYGYLGARGEDQYGNIRVEDYTFTFTTNGGNSSLCTTEFVTSDHIEYTCFVYYYGGNGSGTFTASAGGMSKSVEVVFQ
jgi:hypothetical protein